MFSSQKEKETGDRNGGLHILLLDLAVESSLKVRKRPLKKRWKQRALEGSFTSFDKDKLV